MVQLLHDILKNAFGTHLILAAIPRALRGTRFCDSADSDLAGHNPVDALPKAARCRTRIPSSGGADLPRSIFVQPRLGDSEESGKSEPALVRRAGNWQCSKPASE